MFVKQKYQLDEQSFGSLQTMGTVRAIYPSCAKPHTLYTTYMSGPTFILVNHFTPKIKLITLLNDWGQILHLRFEGNFTTHVMEGVRMI
jgi:hypothetical protein